MKPSLKGNLEELYNSNTVLARNLKSGQFVEFVRRRDTRQFSNGRQWYEIIICGINANGVPCAAYFEPGVDKAYIWQYTDRTAVNDILSCPANAYNWHDVKNGIKAN